MMRIRRDVNRQRGMTLVETLAALLVFGIATVGITPLLVSSLRGTALARSQGLGKEVAREAMERVRGLPFYVSYGTQTSKVDLLDLYLPCADPTLAASGCAGGAGATRSYNATTGVFRIVCSPGSSDPGCAVRLPAGYELVFDTKFVNLDGTTAAIPPADYAWNVLEKDTPSTDMLHVAVTARWVQGGTPRSVQIQSLVSDRKSGGVKVAGTGRLHYAVQVSASYRKPAGLTPEEISDVSAVIGVGESTVESRLVSTADQRFRTAEIRLVKRAEPVGIDLASRIGALGAYRAPPAFSATAGLPATAAQPVMNHPDIVGQEVAFLGATSINSVEVRVDAEQPIARGTFSFPSGDDERYVWVQPQKPEGVITLASNPLRLDYTNPALSLARVDTAQLSGSTEAVTGEVGTATRRVQTKSAVAIKEIRLFPVEYITGTSTRRSIVQITDFEASVDCDARGTSATAVASWSAGIRYWEHGVGYTTVNVSGAVNGGSDLRSVLAVSPDLVRNPLLYRDPLGLAPDLYMFDEPAAGREGYFTTFRFAAPVAAADGTTAASASVNEAINITTVPTNPDFSESGLSISIGKLSCSALDAR